MSDNEDEIEWTTLEDGVEQEPEPEEDEIPEPEHDPDGPELFHRSYMEDRNKKPSWMMVAVVILLILSVFWKKLMVTYNNKNPNQVEKPVQGKVK